MLAVKGHEPYKAIFKYEKLYDFASAVEEWIIHSKNVKLQVMEPMALTSLGHG